MNGQEQNTNFQRRGGEIMIHPPFNRIEQDFGRRIQDIRQEAIDCLHKTQDENDERYLLYIGILGFAMQLKEVIEEISDLNDVFNLAVAGIIFLDDNMKLITRAIDGTLNEKYSWWRIWIEKRQTRKAIRNNKRRVIAQIKLMKSQVGMIKTLYRSLSDAMSSISKGLNASLNSGGKKSKKNPGPRTKSSWEQDIMAEAGYSTGGQGPGGTDPIPPIGGPNDGTFHGM